MLPTKLVMNGEKPVSSDEFETNEIYRRTVKATARVEAEQDFISESLLVSMSNKQSRDGKSFQLQSSKYFQLSTKASLCKKFLGYLKNIDMTLFTIRVKASDEALFEGVVQNFAFHTSVPAETLITSGFGIAENRGRVMMINQDDDCKTFSAEGEYRLMRDPDDLNT